MVERVEMPERIVDIADPTLELVRGTSEFEELLGVACTVKVGQLVNVAVAKGALEALVVEFLIGSQL